MVSRTQEIALAFFVPFSETFVRFLFQKICFKLRDTSILLMLPDHSVLPYQSSPKDYVLIYIR